MNVIMILIDSLNKNALGAYGNKVVRTPNFNRFAEKSAVFHNHFIGSAPCMPARRELMTGRKEFLWRGWGPIEPFDAHIAEEAKRVGAVTAIITDHYHYWEKAAHGYFEAFDAAKLIRGQELDNYNTDTIEECPAWVERINQYRPDFGTRYFKNCKDFKSEEDFFVSKTMTEASDWIDKNHGQEKFMLWVESFDVHEPFHIPEPYRSMYTGHSDDAFNCWPPYQNGTYGHHDAFWDQTTDSEIEFIRAQYYGKVSMVDHWLGKLFDTMDRYSLWDSTLVILTTDHGHELGNRRRFGKQPPHYDDCANIPLFIRHPDFDRRNDLDALTCTVDLYPTILDALGCDGFNPLHGRSLMPLVRGEKAARREAVTYGEFGAGVTVTDGEYTYHQSWNESELNLYTSQMPFCAPDAAAGKYIEGVDCPVWKIPSVSQHPVIPDMLFNRRNDPLQLNNVLHEYPEQVIRMKNLLKKVADEEGIPAEQYTRLNLEKISAESTEEL
ncbi:MAG: sulfatase [Saccharofermentanales bacterium]